MAPASTTISRHIDWVDTDASGHYHFATAFRLFEAAQWTLFARLGLLDETSGRLPRVHASADFKRVLHFTDLVDVRVEIERVGRTSVAMRCEIVHAGELCVEGRLVAVRLNAAEGEPAAWPEAHRELLLGAGPTPG